LDEAYFKVLFALSGWELLREPNLPLLIEVTTLKDDYRILAARVTYEGHCIPLYLKVWRGLNVLYDFWEGVESFIRELGALLAKGRRYMVVGGEGLLWACAA